MATRPEGLTYPCYLIYKDNKGEWRWKFYAANREEIAVSSESYTRKENCRHSVTLMQGSANAAVHEA